MRIAQAFFGRCEVFAVEVRLERSFSPITIVQAALCALLMLSVEDDPDRV